MSDVTPISKEELDNLYEKAKYSGWGRGTGAKLVLRLIAEIKRLQALL